MSYTDANVARMVGKEQDFVRIMEKVDHVQAKQLANYVIGQDHGDEEKLLIASAYLDARLILTQKEEARLRLAEMLRYAQMRIKQLVDQHDR